MEGNCLPEITTDLLGNFGCVNGLTWSNLDSLAAEIGPTANALPDDCTPWTNKKHSLYLTHLEVSFVKHLHRAMDLLVQNSDKKQIDKNISQKRPANVQTAAEQFSVSGDGYCPRISNERDKPFSHVSSDTHDSLSSPWIDNFKCIQRYCQPLSADMHQKLHGTKKLKNRKVIVSPRLATCSKQFFACKSDKADSFHLMKGQTNLSSQVSLYHYGHQLFKSSFSCRGYGAEFCESRQIIQFKYQVSGKEIKDSSSRL